MPANGACRDSSYHIRRFRLPAKQQRHDLHRRHTEAARELAMAYMAICLGSMHMHAAMCQKDASIEYNEWAHTCRRLLMAMARASVSYMRPVPRWMFLMIPTNQSEFPLETGTDHEVARVKPDLPAALLKAAGLSRKPGRPVNCNAELQTRTGSHAVICLAY